jgi:hypothetical protein
VVSFGVCFGLVFFSIGLFDDSKLKRRTGPAECCSVNGGEGKPKAWKKKVVFQGKLA